MGQIKFSHFCAVVAIFCVIMKAIHYKDSDFNVGFICVPSGCQRLVLCGLDGPSLFTRCITRSMIQNDITK